MYATVRAESPFRRRRRVPSGVLCASCGFSFDPAGAKSGDAARCPTCGEIVRLGGIEVAKRRVERTGSAAFAFERRLSRRETRRAIGRLLLVGALAIGAAALWTWRDEIRAALRTAGDATANPR
jgi:hypothetical protein